MAKSGGVADVSAELKALKHTRMNKEMKALPPNTTIQRRPLYHPPIAAPGAGKNAQKVVYVSNHTPIMSAVKRVKKLLSHIEQRAIQSVNSKGEGSRRTFSELAEASDRIRKANEEVLVTASGRAMSQALRVGEWFRNREKEMLCNVEVRTGQVQAIDDIVEIENDDDSQDEDINITKSESVIDESTELTGGETTMELLGDMVKSHEHGNEEEGLGDQGKCETVVSRKDEAVKKKRKKRNRRPRAVYDKDNVPEARVRWIKTVEIAISLKG